MEHVIAYTPAILKATALTVQLASASLVLSVIMGLLGAWAKLSKSLAARKLGEAYTTLIRGVPDLVLMLLLFYGGQTLLNKFGDFTGLWGYVEIDQFVAGILTIGFIFGAYMTETFRGAFLAIPRGQIEAGIAAGMNPPKVFVRIIWPQLVRFALPSFGNNWLVLLKVTALVSVLGLQELVYITVASGRTVRQLFTFLFVALVIYLILTIISDVCLRWLERKYTVGERRA